MTLVDGGFCDRHSMEARQWSEVKTGFTHFQSGDIGIAKITPCFENRKSVVFRNLHNGHGAGTTELYILRPISSVLLPEYALFFVKTERFIQGGIASFSGAVGQQRVSKDYIENTLFPIPPIAEQRRIVESVKEMFFQIDLIEENL